MTRTDRQQKVAAYQETIAIAQCQPVTSGPTLRQMHRDLHRELARLRCPPKRRAVPIDALGLPGMRPARAPIVRRAEVEDTPAPAPAPPPEVPPRAPGDDPPAPAPQPQDPNPPAPTEARTEA